MSDWAVTVNLGGSWLSEARRSGMIAWTRGMLRDRAPALIFAQEAFADWLHLCDDAGYKVVKGVDRGWKVHSALVYRSDLELERLTERDLPNLRYHGNYVASARWNRADGQQIVLASVHASPNFAEPERDGWPSTAESPQCRHGGEDPRWPHDRLWDSDFVLITLRELHRTVGLPLLAAGDLNESLMDDPPNGTWAKEYFVNARQYGLHPWLHDRWQTERQTRGGLQLDHILATEDALALLDRDPEPEVDEDWSDVAVALTLSDHAPIWFRLAAAAGVRDTAAGSESNGKTMAKEEGQAT